jgi:hypothetical protein
VPFFGAKARGGFNGNVMEVPTLPNSIFPEGTNHPTEKGWVE